VWEVWDSEIELGWFLPCEITSERAVLGSWSAINKTIGGRIMVVNDLTRGEVVSARLGGVIARLSQGVGFALQTE